MTAALIVLVFTISSAPADPRFTTALIGPTIDALGRETRVILRPVTSRPSDTDALAVAADVHADAVAEVSWSAPDQLRAVIRLERGRGAPWMERTAEFLREDDPLERSRTVALTIASMLLSKPSTTAPDDRPGAPATPAGVAAAAAAPKAGDQRRSMAQPSSPQSQAPAYRHAHALSAAGIAALGVGDHAGGVGGALAYGQRLSARLSLRAGAGVRAGRDPTAQAVTRFFHAGVGLGWDAFLTPNGEGTLGLRADAMVIVAELVRDAADQPSSANVRKWMPGADVVAEGCYAFTQGIAAFVGAGAEAMLGRTDVFVGGQRVTRISPLHPVFELGLRAVF